MSMRALWAVLFVVTPLAAVAGYGSTYGTLSGGGGGVSEGGAISGAAASRLLWSNASSELDTATPVAVTSSLDLTSGTLDVGGACTLDSTLGVAGQATFTRDPASTASADATVRINPATSAANERLLVIQDNTTDEFWVDKEGDAQLTGALQVGGTTDLRGAASNGGAATCGATAVTGSGGSLCVNDALTAVGVVRIAIAGQSTPATLTPDAAGGLQVNSGSSAAVVVGAGQSSQVSLLVGSSSAAADSTSVLLVGETCSIASGCTGARAAGFYGGGLAALGNTHQTASITGAANLDPVSSRIILTCATAASSFAITLQETTVAATGSLAKAFGADVTICSSMSSNASCTLTFADVAGVFNGASPSLGAGDCFRIFYADEADDIWLQASPVSDN